MKNRFRSFAHAVRGIGELFRLGFNARIQLFVALAVTTAGIVCQIDAVEWALIVICIGMVLSAEAFNTAIEQLADEVDACPNERIRVVKDLAAGAVLLSALASAVVGACVFLV